MSKQKLSYIREKYGLDRNKNRKELTLLQQSHILSSQLDTEPDPNIKLSCLIENLAVFFLGFITGFIAFRIL